MVTMFSKLRRIGTKPCKVQISIELKELNITNASEDITLVCIELRKGNKFSTSSSKVWSHAGALCVKFDEQLVLLMTLYKNPSGTYIEKNGKLHLNGHSKTANSAVFLGSADVRLSLLASDADSQMLTFHFMNKDGNKIGYLSATVTSKLIGDGYVNDDDASCSSSMSEASTTSYQLKDVRFGSIYHRDHAGKIDPDVGSATTEKLRSNILKIVPSKNAHDDDDVGSSNDGYGTTEAPETTTQSADSPMIVHNSGKKYRADEFITPRTKLAFSYSAKDEEIADLHRELEQANRRASVAQQEQRNFAAVRIADLRKHEDAVNAYSSKIQALEAEIESLNSSKQISVLQNGELDNGDDTINVIDDSEQKREQETADNEENIRLRKDIEVYQHKLKASMASEIGSATEVIRLQALVSSTLHTVETDNVTAANKALLLVQANADEVQNLNTELSHERDLKAALELQLARNKAEMELLNTDKIKALTDLKAVVIEKERLEASRADLLSVISTMGKKAALSECETIKDLRVQLSINRVSQNTLLLDEISVLESEIDRLQDIEANSAKVSLTLKDVQSELVEAKNDKNVLLKELTDLKKEKKVLEKELGSARNNVTTLEGKVDSMTSSPVSPSRTVTSEGNHVQPTHIAQNNVENNHHLRADESLDGCADRNHDIDAVLSAFEAEEHLNECDIEKQIIQAEEDIIWVKEKRVEFQQYKHSKRFSQGVGNEKEIMKRTENSSPFLISNTLIESEATQLVLNIPAMHGAQQSVQRNKKNIHVISDLDPKGGPIDDLTDSTYFDYGTHSPKSLTMNVHNVHNVAIDGNMSTEKSVFERRMRSLLRSLGMNEHTYTKFMSCNDHSDEKWDDIVRILSDSERKKFMILRSCLIRFSSKLTPSEIDDLEDCGIVLGPRISPRKMGLNLGSALCFA